MFAPWPSLEHLVELYRNHLRELLGPAPDGDDMNQALMRLKNLGIANYDQGIVEKWKWVVGYEDSGAELKAIVKSLPKKQNVALVSVASGLAVLEIFLAKTIYTSGHVACFDISKAMTIAATNFKQMAGVGNITPVCASADSLALPPHSQDLVRARRTELSATDKWEGFLGEITRVLKRNADSRLIFTVEERKLAQEQKLLSDFKAVRFQSIQEREFLEKDGTPISVFICGY